MLTIEADHVLQKTDWSEKRWTFAEVLEAASPFYGVPLAELNPVLQKVAATAANMPIELSETGRLHLDFWLNFQPRKIPEHHFVYKTGNVAENRWLLLVNEAGLLFHDLSNQYASPQYATTEQAFCEFWFYGPHRPMPDLRLRQQVVDLLKKGFANLDCAAAQAHFELFEYPRKSLAGLNWSEGDHVRSDYFTVIGYGIEMSHTTFRDGPSGTGYLSFERFLNLPPAETGYISPEIRGKIEDYLEKSGRFSPPRPLETVPKPLTPREKMDLAESLLQNPASEEGAEILLSLLEYEAESDYWRNYVFNRCARLRENPVVQKFIADCLGGDQEIWFNKARDVLSFWGFHLGDKAFMDRELLLALNWDDATANDPDFRAALAKVLKIIHS
jgi:hypothetical protein